MAIRKFKDITYDLSTTDGYLCNTITPITATSGETVNSIEVFNDIVINSSDPARPLTSTNMNSTIDDIQTEISGKVSSGRTVNNKSLITDIDLNWLDVGAEKAFNKNTAFNKNFGTNINEVCIGNDDRLSNSRKCNNTFDDVVMAKTNLGLHSVATSGNYNQLINKPYIPNNYDFYPGILTSAIAGFNNLGNLSSSSDTMIKTINYKKKYCFVGYGGYTAGMIYNISGGSWVGNSVDFISNCVIIPSYTGSMAGSEKRFIFITNEGRFEYLSPTGSITIKISRPDCYAFKEDQFYTYY